MSELTDRKAELYAIIDYLTDKELFTGLRPDEKENLVFNQGAFAEILAQEMIDKASK